MGTHGNSHGDEAGPVSRQFVCSMRRGVSRVWPAVLVQRKGLGVGVPFVDSAADVGFEFGDAAVGGAESAVGGFGVPALDQVEPRAQHELAHSHRVGVRLVLVTGPGGFDVGDVLFGPESYGAERDEEGAS